MADAGNRIFEEYHEGIFARGSTLNVDEFDRFRGIYERSYGASLPADKDGEILDIGCGTGHFLHYLKKKSYRNYYGIDISKGQVEFCRNNVTERACVADAFEFLRDRKGRYDAIVANDFLEHVPKERTLEILGLVKEALKDTGVFLLKVPNMANPFAIYLRYKDFTHEAGYTELSLYQVMYSAGFRNIDISGQPSGIPVWREKALHFLLTKLYWWQGFVAPRVMHPVLVGKIRK